MKACWTGCSGSPAPTLRPSRSPTRVRAARAPGTPSPPCRPGTRCTRRTRLRRSLPWCRSGRCLRAACAASVLSFAPCSVYRLPLTVVTIGWSPSVVMDDRGWERSEALTRRVGGHQHQRIDRLARTLLPSHSCASARITGTRTISRRYSAVPRTSSIGAPRRPPVRRLSRSPSR